MFDWVLNTPLICVSFRYKSLKQTLDTDWLIRDSHEFEVASSLPPGFYHSQITKDSLLLDQP